MQVSGYVGQFRSLIQGKDGSQEEVAHGAIIVASGGQEIQPKGYSYGQLSNVITQHELEERLAEAETLPEQLSLSRPVVMIQCVGSRDENHPYCSRICCSQAIKNALEIKRRSPKTPVAILYRDIRSYGFRERFYREARRAGVVFLQFDPDQPPQVSEVDGKLRVQVLSQPEDELVNLEAGMVVLSAGIEAQPGNTVLSRLLKLPLTAEGFFLEAHVKLRPVDFAADGVYLCGLAHSPRSLDETIAQAQAAAVRAVTLLSRPSSLRPRSSPPSTHACARPAGCAWRCARSAHAAWSRGWHTPRW